MADEKRGAISNGSGLWDCDPDGWRDDPEMSHDAEFMVHARTDIPALLDEVERLQATLNDPVACYRAALTVGYKALGDQSVTVSPMVEPGEPQPADTD